jgi:outer membrane lipoprotein-sorting protein
VAVRKAVPVSITAEAVTKEAVSAVANADKAIADKAATTVVVARTEAVVTVKVVHQEDNNRKLN